MTPILSPSPSLRIPQYFADEESDSHGSFFGTRNISSRDVQDGLNLNDTASFTTGHGKLFYGDYNALFDTIADGSVDVIFTDPPYWTLDKHRAVGTTARLGGGLNQEHRDGTKFFDTIDRAQLWEIIGECGRVLKNDGICWMMCDGQTLAFLLGMVAEPIEDGDKSFPFTYFKPFPVLKRAAGTGGLKSGMGYHGRCCHEYVVFLQKGKKNTLRQKTNWNDVFDAGMFEEAWNGDAWSRQYTPDGEKYPATKPLSLIQRLIELSSDEGETVFDPFSGSGSTAVAAIYANRRYLAGDHAPRAIQTSQNAINAALLCHDFASPAVPT